MVEMRLPQFNMGKSQRKYEIEGTGYINPKDRETKSRIIVQINEQKS